MKNQNWYKWYPARYRADTMHLTAEQDGTYRRLIDHYMETSQPLPDSFNALARIAGVSPSELEGNWPVLCHFFTENQGKLHLKVCDELIQDRHEKSEKFREFGKRGGRPKKINDFGMSVSEFLDALENPTLNPELNPSQSQTKADKIRGDKNIDIPNGISPPMVPQKTESSSKEEQEYGTDLPETVPATGGKPKAVKGTRLNQWLEAYGPANGTIPPDWIEWVERKYGWDDNTIQHIAERFWRYFTGPDAKEPVKKDWKRAFQGWCDRDLGSAQAFIRARTGSGGGQKQGYSSAVAGSSEKARQLLDAGRGEHDDTPDFDESSTDAGAKGVA